LSSISILIFSDITSILGEAKFLSRRLVWKWYYDIVPLRGQLFREKLELDGAGRVIVPERPGLGFTPNYELLERYRV
jgi:hypothetical protein